MTTKEKTYRNREKWECIRGVKNERTNDVDDRRDDLRQYDGCERVGRNAQTC